MRSLSRLAVTLSLVSLGIAGCGSDEVAPGTNDAPTTLLSGTAFAVRVFATPPQGVGPLEVTFAAAVTGAPDTTTYSWNFGDNSDTDTTAGPTHTFTTPGVYTVMLTATSDDKTAQDGVQVTVDDPEQRDLPPLSLAAFATPPFGSAPLAVAFSTALTGSAAAPTFSWDFGDGSDADTTAEPSHSYTTAGSYTVLVTVQDAGRTAQAGLQVLVDDGTTAGPTLAAQAFGAPTHGVAPLAVTFSAVASGTQGAVSHNWSFGDGTADATTASPNHSFTAPGVYNVLLTVTDANGSAQRGMQIVVGDNMTPRVSAYATPARGLGSFETQLHAEAGGGNPPLTYLWDFGTGADPSPVQNPIHRYTASTDTTFTAQVTVTDSDGDSDTASVDIFLEADLAVSVAPVSASPLSGMGPLLVTFDCQAVGGNAPLRTLWEFGDGQVSREPAIAHTYATGGDYTARCTVVDANGDTASATTNITVTANAPPTADLQIGGDYLDNPSAPAYALRGQPIYLDASASVSGDGTDDAGDQIISYAWSFDQLPVGSSASFQNASVANPWFTPDVDGDYVMRVTVSDLRQQIGTTTSRLTVEWACQFSGAPGTGGQVVTVGQPFGSALAVEVMTPHGILAADVPLLWSTDNGTFAQDYTVTDSLGLSSSLPTAGPLAGQDIELTVQVADAPSCNYLFTAAWYFADAPDFLRVFPPASMSTDDVGAGTLPQISGFVSDRFGNVAAGASTVVSLEITVEESNDGPSPSQPDSMYFASIDVGGTSGGDTPGVGARNIWVTTANGAFAVTLNTQHHEAEWYNIRVLTADGYEARSDWMNLWEEDFENIDPTEWNLQDDWEVGTPTSGPSAAVSGRNVLATNLSGNHSLQTWNGREASTRIEFPLPNTTEYMFTFTQWLDSHLGTDCNRGDGPAGGMPWDERGNLRWAPTSVPYTISNCWGSQVWAGDSGGWMTTEIGPFGGYGFDPYGGGDSDEASIGFRFEETDNRVPRPGWYIDDASIRHRFTENFAGQFFPGATDGLFLLHMGVFTGGPPPPGIVTGSPCPGGQRSGLPVTAIYGVVDQYGNLRDDDNTTEWDVQITADASTMAPPAGTILFSLTDVSQIFGRGNGPPVYWGQIQSVSGTTVRVRAANGLVFLDIEDDTAETIEIVSASPAPAMSGLPTALAIDFAPDTDDDSDGWTVGCGDCNDVTAAGGATVNPSAPEDCGDGIDNNCDDRPDCYDNGCQSTPRCFGWESCAAPGFVLLADLDMQDNLCNYSDDFNRVGTCRPPNGNSQNDAVYVFQAPADGEYTVCVSEFGFEGDIMLSVAGAPCGDTSNGWCAGGGCWDLFLNSADFVTIEVDSSNCGDIGISIFDRNGP